MNGLALPLSRCIHIGFGQNESWLMTRTTPEPVPYFWNGKASNFSRTGWPTATTPMSLLSTLTSACSSASRGTSEKKRLGFANHRPDRAVGNLEHDRVYRGRSARPCVGGVPPSSDPRQRRCAWQGYRRAPAGPCVENLR